MKISCPKCKSNYRSSNESKKFVVKGGRFYRKSDRKSVQRYFCRRCQHSFSNATFSDCYYQKKRHLNSKVARLFVSGVSIREGHKILRITRKTFVRKFVFMAHKAKLELIKFNRTFPKVQIMEFDDLETFEHTKCKPVSVTVAVEFGSRRILGYEVAQMPAKGLLAKKSVKKYGHRIDLRPRARARLFTQIAKLTEKNCLIKSDENTHYLRDIRRFFPEAKHTRYKGRDGCIVGQGELKKIGFDPLFSLNHTFATLRARANRLFRRTWCTTKSIERLDLHLALVALHHNLQLNI